MMNSGSRSAFLPDALTTAAEHDAAVTGFCESGVKLTEQRVAEGKYAEGRTDRARSGERSLRSKLPPGAELLAHLSEPGYFNKTIGRSLSPRSRR